MRLFVLLNRSDDLVPTQTTAMLVEEASRRGHEVWLGGVTSLGLNPDGGVSAQALMVPPADQRGHVCDWLKSPQRGGPQALDASACEAWLIRTNPGRDAAHRADHASALELARLARDRGVVVLNDPTGLSRARSKLYLGRLPAEVRPLTLVSRDRAAIRAFIAARAPDPAVIKPVEGSRGTDVFRVTAEDPNLNALIDVIAREGYVMVQEFLPEAAEGDTRVVLLDGEPLVIDGELCAIRRVPAVGDFRSNLHTGGRAERAPLTPEIARIAKLCGPALQGDGLWLVGLDLIGGRVIEANVYATGGFRDAERFTGKGFIAAVIEALEAKVAS